LVSDRLIEGVVHVEVGSDARHAPSLMPARPRRLLPAARSLPPASRLPASAARIPAGCSLLAVIPAARSLPPASRRPPGRGLPLGPGRGQVLPSVAVARSDDQACLVSIPWRAVSPAPEAPQSSQATYSNLPWMITPLVGGVIIHNNDWCPFAGSTAARRACRSRLAATTGNRPQAERHHVLASKADERYPMLAVSRRSRPCSARWPARRSRRLCRSR
jgi:hypothetical protein